MQTLNRLFALASFSIIISGCGNYDKGSSSFSSGFREFSGAAITFEEVKTKILEPHCLRCHIQYNQYDSVKIESKQILDAVLGNRMPKNAAPLSPDLKGILAQWVTSGAPLGGDTAPPPVDQELKPNWESLSRRVIAPKCMVCHNPNGQASFLDLSTRQAIFENRDRDYFGQKLIDFEQPEESYLVSIVQDEFEPMPPPPPVSNLERLTDREVEALIQWIKKGLP